MAEIRGEKQGEARPRRSYLCSETLTQTKEDSIEENKQDITEPVDSLKPREKLAVLNSKLKEPYKGTKKQLQYEHLLHMEKYWKQLERTIK